MRSRNLRFWPNPWSRWLDIGRVLFLAFLWTETTLRSIKTEKKNEAYVHLSWTEHAWSKRIYHTAKRFRFIKNQEWIVYFESRERRESCVCSTINPRELFMLSFYHFFLHLNSVIDSASFHSSYKLSYCQTPQQECLEGMINNSKPKLELLIIGEAVISHEFRE